MFVCVYPRCDQAKLFTGQLNFIFACGSREGTTLISISEDIAFVAVVENFPCHINSFLVVFCSARFPCLIHSPVAAIPVKAASCCALRTFELTEFAVRPSLL
jgi:hypothetical protein